MKIEIPNDIENEYKDIYKKHLIINNEIKEELSKMQLAKEMYLQLFKESLIPTILTGILLTLFITAPYIIAVKSFRSVILSVAAILVELVILIIETVSSCKSYNKLINKLKTEINSISNVNIVDYIKYLKDPDFYTKMEHDKYTNWEDLYNILRKYICICVLSKDKIELIEKVIELNNYDILDVYEDEDKLIIKYLNTDNNVLKQEISDYKFNETVGINDTQLKLKDCKIYVNKKYTIRDEV